MNKMRYDAFVVLQHNIKRRRRRKSKTAGFSTPLKAAVFGDSITFQNSNNNRFEAYGSFTAANVMSGQRFDFDDSLNYGLGGDDSSELLARVSVLGDIGADIGVLMVGTNDIGVNHSTSYPPTSAIMANINAIISHLQNTSKVKTIILGTCPPSDLQEAEQNTARDDLNAAIRARADGVNVILWDYWGAVTNGYSWKAYYSHDGVHPNMTGAAAMGRELYKVLNSRFGSRNWEAKAGNILPNPSLAGDGGTISSSIFQGELADGWDDSGSGGSSANGTLSKDTDDKQIVSFDFDIAGTFSRRIYQRYTDVSGLIGKKAYFETEIEVLQENTGNGTWYNLSAEIRNSAELAIGFDRMGSNDNVADAILKDFTAETGRKLILRTPIAVIPDGTTYLDGRINLQFKNDAGESCSGSIKVHNAQLVVMD